MLGFGNAPAASLAQLLAKRKYARAVDLVREQLRTRGGDRRLQVQLADVLQLAGRAPEAVPVLLEIADGFALAGSAAKAIATLKRAQAIAPGQPEVEEHLAYLIAQQEAPTPDPWSRARTEIEANAPAVAADDTDQPTFLGDMEEMGADVAADPVRLAPEPEAVAGPAPAGEAHSDGLENLADDVLNLVDDVVSGRVALTTPAMTAVPAVETPLFGDFSCDELVEVIRGLELRSFAAGEIVVTEGEPGNSLFVVTTGTVRTYVRDGSGHSNPVRVLREGDFFGEVSLLESEVRTATVTAASRCDLLEIDRATLDTISRTKPRIWDVVRRFYQARADSEAERTAREGASARTR
jgi:hypothetical protein